MWWLTRSLRRRGADHQYSWTNKIRIQYSIFNRLLLYMQIIDFVSIFGTRFPLPQASPPSDLSKQLTDQNATTVMIISFPPRLTTSMVFCHFHALGMTGVPTLRTIHDVQ